MQEADIQEDRVVGVGSQVLEAGMALGRASSGIDGPLRSWRAKKLRALFTEGALLRLQFPKEDLGFVYKGEGTAILPDGPLTPPKMRERSHQRHAGLPIEGSLGSQDR